MSVSGTSRSLTRWLRAEQLEDRTTPTAVVVNPNSFASGRVLITLADGADAITAVSRLNASPLTTGVESLGLDVYQVNLQPGVSLARAISTLSVTRGVQLVEADYTITTDATPNDTSFGSMWGLNNTGQNGGKADADIDAPEAWEKAKGTGDTIVAVIDTGVDYNHTDLAANMWKNSGEVAGDGKDNDGNGIIDDVYGADFANNDGNPMDDNGHGTHVAGTIGAVGNNNLGVTGVAWKTKIMALKFLGSNGSGSTSNAVKAINYAVGKGAKILNNSWGGGGYSSSLETAIKNARDKGVIVVAAAGNSATNTDTTANYPSNYNVDNVVSVAATDRNDNLASYSNYGATTVDLAAPGSSILSTTPNNTYSTYSGTSMATPHVSGALAVFWDKNPTLTYKEVISKLLGSVDTLSSLSGKVASGGRLNLNNLLDSVSTSPPPASPPASPPPASPPPASPPADTTGARVTSASFFGAKTGTFDTVRLTFNEAIDSSSFTLADVVKFTGPNVTGLRGGSTPMTITPTAVKAVSGTNNQFDVTFAAVSTLGTYSITIGPSILDLAGNAMDQNQNGVNGETTADQYSGSGVL